MLRLSTLGAVALTLLPSPSAASLFAWPFNVFATAPVTLTAAEIQRELGPKLSKNAVIYAENDPRFEEATARWNAYMPPRINVVVEAGIEEDIPHIVGFLRDSYFELAVDLDRLNLQTATASRS